MKRIVIVGANGTIGRKVSEFLSGDGEIIKVGRNSGDHQVDMADPNSVRALFEKIGPFDHLVVTAGEVAFSPLKQLTHDHWETGIRSKFMGQVNLVQIGSEFIRDSGSFTLTSGVLSDAFIAAGTSATAINRAVEGFAQAAAAEISRGIRINVVSPGMLESSKDTYGAFFPGHIPVPDCRVAQSYRRSVMGIETGKIFRVTKGLALS